MEIADVERLVELVQNANIREITLKQNSSRVTIRKSAPSGSSASTELTPSEWGSTHENGLNYSDYDDSNVGDELVVPEEVLEVVTSPLVGIYRHVKPMIGLGARVTTGQVIGVIEAMKIINEVTCEVSGRIVDVMVEDGQPVEYGQPLYAVEPLA